MCVVCVCFCVHIGVGARGVWNSVVYAACASVHMWLTCTVFVFVLAPQHANGAVSACRVWPCVYEDVPPLSASGHASSHTIIYHISRPHASPRCCSHTNPLPSEMQKLCLPAKAS